MPITKEEFYRNHRRCPGCNSLDLIKTFIPIEEDPEVDFVDDKNKFHCKNCGQEGAVLDLLPLED